MFKMMRKRKAKGFTLVELLIVMVIIGILAGAMLLVMGSGKDKANATKIVSNLRSLKAAALMYYGDNNDWPDEITDLEQYMDRPVDSSDYSISDTGDYVCVVATPSTDGVKKALTAMAEDSGLYGGPDSDDSIYSNDEDVYMRISTQ